MFWSETVSETWVPCYGDVWVRWSTVNRIEIPQDRTGDFAVVFVIDVGTGETRIKYKAGSTKEEARQMVQDLFEEMRRGRA